ncbi:transcriptional regulator [Halorubrum salipaludis]|uniref:Transcriptional regulator n=1 Tax=Halorubrum salipaludis TaxID=2032630 RepID=A0A2A2FJZ9_9EURY|nr:metalloregulator ArsR/SmtB family transcription factor [Halorubrum salipaludis]PAU84909.1 transcriptional regulator [Halorubrum salipaludis]
MREREGEAEERSDVAKPRPEGYERVESELLNNALDLDREAERLKAMGEPTRFTLLYLLSQEGQIGSGELADVLDRRQNDLYHHLNTLEDAGLVGKFRDGQTRVYELSPLAEAFVPQLFEAINDRAEAV